MEKTLKNERTSKPTNEQKLMKKYCVQREKFKKNRFSGENRLFRRFLESSGFKNQFYWQLNHAWWWVLLLIMFLCEKTTKYKEKVRWKSAKTAISGIFPAFSAGKKFFSKIRLGHVLEVVLNMENQKKLFTSGLRSKTLITFFHWFPDLSPLWNSLFWFSMSKTTCKTYPWCCDAKLSNGQKPRAAR